jgi:hypothetical protein
MKLRDVRRGLLAVLLLLIGAGNLAIAADDKKKLSPEDEVKALEMARGEALVKGDTVAVSQMTAEEFFEITRLGTIKSKAENMRDLSAGDLKLTSVKYEDLTVKVYGAVALLRGVADNTGTFRGMPFAGKIRYMRVFVKRNNRWQAVAMQHTMMQ